MPGCALIDSSFVHRNSNGHQVAVVINHNRILDLEPSLPSPVYCSCLRPRVASNTCHLSAMFFTTVVLCREQQLVALPHYLKDSGAIRLRPCEGTTAPLTLQVPYMISASFLDTSLSGFRTLG